MSQATHLKQLITNYSRRLEKLKEQRASQGLTTDPAVLMEIEDIEAEMETLYEEVENVSAPPSFLFTQPPPPRRFTGRSALLAELGKILTGSEGAVVALQGMGGVGKTMIAQKVAETLRVDFSGGILWADLSASAGKVGSILQSWGRVCGATLSKEQDVLQMQGILTEHQARFGRLLMIIDDVREEWVAAAQVLRQALPAQASLLLTTREYDLALALGCELVQRLGILPRAEALTLLERHAGPTIVAQENKAAITLLAELGHLPLAIKLAGQWLAKFSHKYRTMVIARLIKAIRQRGVESLEVPGQIGLRATFDLTYEDLSPDLQRLFQGLGIFATGTVSLRHVAGLLRLGVTETELKLDELVNVALLDWDEAADEDVVGYTIHPLLQQYARLLLEKSGEWPAMQQTYLNYYATFAETHNQNTPEAHNRLEKALADLSQAGRWAVDFAQPQGSNTLALALSEQSQFLLVRGHYHLALELLTWAIQASQELGDGPAEAIHCKNIGKVYDSLGRYNEAKKYYLQSLAYFQSDQADKLQLCEIRYYLASLHVIEQEYERATALIEQNLAIITQIPEKAAQQRIEAQTFYVLSNVAIRQQNLTKAKTLVEQSLALYDTLQDTQGQIGAYYNLGIILAQQGKDTAQARSFFQKCLSFWHEQGDITFQIYTLLQLVMLERAQENYSLVLDYLEQAERLCQKINDVALQVTVKRQRGLTHLASQDEEAACQEWQTALVLADDHLRQSLLSLIAEHCSG